MFRFRYVHVSIVRMKERKTFNLLPQKKKDKEQYLTVIVLRFCNYEVTWSEWGRFRLFLDSNAA